MATQRKSQGKGWHLIRQRASNILRRITKRQGLQKHAEKTQREAANSALPQENIVISETPETQVPAIGSRLPSQNNNSTSLGTWLDAFEQTQSLYPWLARGSSFINDNETPFQVSNDTLELDSENIYANLPRNRRGLIVNSDLANSFQFFKRRADQYTVRAALSSRRSSRRSSSRGSTSTGHDQLDVCLSSPLLCSSAGRRLEALADELLLSLGVGPSPIVSKHESRYGEESQTSLAQDPEPCAQFEGFSNRFSFRKPASIQSIISSLSPTQTPHTGREDSASVDFTFFPELRRWVRKHGSSSDRSASTQHPHAKCGICKVSNLEIHELGRSNSSTAGETETATVLPCGHMFGKDCLALWRTANKGGFSCPTCRSTLVFSSCKHAIPGLVVGKTADVPLTSPEGGRIPTYCNDCRLSKIRDGCVELARLIYDDFEYTEAECRRAAWHMVPLAVEAAQRATVERVMGSWGWGNTEMLV
ncbi:hypothetical protein MCOR19_001908 [Pyricularia oryzae]|nr:hypothetical protein MCOR19_001908 [Pyricularia oryzae]KAI6498827.1 hypothetical protein MCOR18_000018 [Pyricularia oryzae]